MTASSAEVTLMRHSMRRKSSLLKIAGIIVVVGLVLGSDWAARLWLNIYRPSIALIRKNGSPAYANSPYWGPSFWEEEDALGASAHLDGNGKWTVTYHGHWFNVDDGIRYTAYQPVKALYTVYVFGNSAIFGFGVPDEDTIPSQLQVRFNKYYGDVYRVINVAADGESVASALQKLKTINLSRGDTVIFYDGIADILGIFQHIDVRRNSSRAGQFCNTLAERLWRLGLVQMYCTLSDKTIPPQQIDSAQLNRFGDQYRTMLLDAYKYTIRQGAQFYHFLQPHLWTISLSPYEKAIEANPDLVEPGLDKLIVTVWPSLQAASNTIPSSTDFSHVLDTARQDGIMMYIDFGHVTDIGNAIISKNIFETITVF